MAISVNEVYKTVLTILNKEQRGYMTPEEFNRIGTQVQRETFEIRMAGSSFSTAALLDASQKEIAFYEQLIENEKRLFLSNLQIKHIKRELLSRFNLSL